MSTARRLMPFLVGLFLVAFVGIAMVLLAGGGARIDDPYERLHLVDAPIMGNETADVLIVAFESPTCDACRAFHYGDGRTNRFAAVVNNFVTPGDARFVAKVAFEGQPLERELANALRCMWHDNEEGHWALMYAMYERAPNINGGNIWSFLERWGFENNYDGIGLVSCAKRGVYDAHVDQDVADARSLAVREVPSFIVIGPDGRYEVLEGPVDVATFRLAIDHVRSVAEA